MDERGSDQVLVLGPLCLWASFSSRVCAAVREGDATSSP